MSGAVSLAFSSDEVTVVVTIPQTFEGKFNELEPGTLFIGAESDATFFGIKTADDYFTTLVLGPVYPFKKTRPFVLPYEPSTVFSLGKDFALRWLSSAVWSQSCSDHTRVWLSLAGGKKIVRADGSNSPGGYHACFVDLDSGRVFERSIGVPALNTDTWEIVATLQGRLMHEIVRFGANH